MRTESAVRDKTRTPTVAIVLHNSLMCFQVVHEREASWMQTEGDSFEIDFAGNLNYTMRVEIWNSYFEYAASLPPYAALPHLPCVCLLS